MQKVSCSRPDGVQDKKEKKQRKKPGLYGGKKRGGGNEVEKQRIGEMKRARARNQILFYSYGK